MKRAIIVGSGGQDGRILFDRLRNERYQVIGIEREGVRSSELHPMSPVNIADQNQVGTLIRWFLPDEVYYLAACHHSAEEETSTDLDHFQHSFSIHVAGLLCFLHGIVSNSRHSRLFYAASSHIFGSPSESPQHEGTPFAPTCIYGVTKTAGLHCCRFYRDTHSIFAAVGILYNHESVFRKSSFVSQRIVRGAIEIKRGKRAKLMLGNLEAQIDWGYAPDYVDAMVRIINAESPTEFIAATGKQNTVRDFVRTAFDVLGMNWSNYVEENPGLIKKPQSRNLVGNAEKLRKATGWEPTLTFEQMVERLVREQEKSY